MSEPDAALRGLAKGASPISSRSAERHQDLPTDLKIARPALALEGVRDVGDHTHVGGDVVTYHAVAPGEGAEQLAVNVVEADGGSVKLEFAAVGEALSKGLVGPLGKRFHLLDGISVAQGEHRVSVRILCKAALQVRAHLLGGGVRSYQFRKLRFKSFQGLHSLVKVVIAHSWGVQYIVPVRVLLEQFPELVYLEYGFAFVHYLTNLPNYY